MAQLIFRVSRSRLDFDADEESDNWDFRLDGQCEKGWNLERFTVKHGENTYTGFGAPAAVYIHKRPPRSEVRGIPSAKPFDKDDAHRDIIRVHFPESMDEQPSFEINISLPPDAYQRVIDVDWTRQRLQLFVGTGVQEEALINVPHEWGEIEWLADKREFAYLNKVSVHFLPLSSKLPDEADDDSLPVDIDPTVMARYESIQTEDSTLAFLRDTYSERDLWTTKQLAEAVALAVVRRNVSQGLSRYDRVNDALDLINSLQDNLQKVAWLFMDGKLNESQREFFGKIDRKAIFWWSPDAKQMSEIPTAAKTLNPYYTDQISLGCFSYLARPWMEYPRLEVALVNALTYLRTLEVGLSIKAARRGWRVRAVFRALVALTLGLGCAASYGFAVGALAGLTVWSVLTLVKILGEDWKIEGRRQRLFTEMLSMSQMTADVRTSPKAIRDLMYSTQKDGAAWPAGMIALVENAAQRDSITWCGVVS